MYKIFPYVLFNSRVEICNFISDFICEIVTHIGLIEQRVNNVGINIQSIFQQRADEIIYLYLLYLFPNNR
jgi:hypothetical protein